MASVKMQYVVQSCPVCGKKLLKAMPGSKTIGSPLITCRKCGTVVPTPFRCEWYAYQPKWLVFIWPPMLAVVMLITGTLMEDAAIGVMAAILGFLMGLCFSGAEVIRILKSRKRMRSVQYLKQLYQYRLISREDCETFLIDAK